MYTGNHILQPVRNGLKLITKHNKQESFNFQSYISMSDIFNLSCNVFILTLDGIILDINDEQANFFNLNKKEILHHTLNRFFTKASTHQLLKNNNNVIENEKLHIVEETVYLKGHSPNGGLSIKFPCYHESGKILGVFGFGIVYARDNIAEILTKIHQMNILNCSLSQLSYLEPLKINNISLTHRELECVKLTVRGKSAKEIGNCLSISSRTVEFHLENIKSKLNVYTKKQVVDLFMDYIFDRLL